MSQLPICEVCGEIHEGDDDADHFHFEVQSTVVALGTLLHAQDPSIALSAVAIVAILFSTEYLTEHGDDDFQVLNRYANVCAQARLEQRRA